MVDSYTSHTAIEAIGGLNLRALLSVLSANPIGRTLEKRAIKKREFWDGKWEKKGDQIAY